jgi:tetratricopeptide (TPR) repeat protein
LQQSLRLLREVGSPDEIGRTLLNLGKFASHLGEVVDAGAYYHEALTVLQEAGDRLGMVYAYNGLGNYYKRRGKLQQAADDYTQSLQLAQEIGALQDQEQALGNLGTLYHQRGAWAEAERYYRQAAELCEAVDDEAGLAVWLGNLALVLGLQGQELEARPLLERQLLLHRRYDNRSGEGVALLNLATHYRDVDELETAESYFQEAATVAREIQRPDLEARIQAAWGSVPWRQERFAEAQTMFERALALYKRQDNPRGQLTALYKLAGLHYEREAWTTARTFAEAAWDVGQTLDIPYWHGRVLWLLGDIALEQGDDQGAVYLAEAALRAATVGDDQRVQLSLQAILERVTAYDETGDRSRALALCRKALVVWEQQPEKVPEAMATLTQVVEILEA